MKCKTIDQPIACIKESAKVESRMDGRAMTDVEASDGMAPGTTTSVEGTSAGVSCSGPGATAGTPGETAGGSEGTSTASSGLSAGGSEGTSAPAGARAPSACRSTT